MKRLESPPAPIPQHDYALALKSAVSWLGDRTEYFVETRRWHDARNAKGPAGNMAR